MTSFFRHHPTHQVVLYGKPRCHLCEDARAVLAHLQRRYHLEIEEVDITRDPALFRKYDIRIPVIVIDGKVEIEAPVAETALRRAIERAEETRGH